MRVFISWSGDKSREVAEALRFWLPQVLQTVEPFMSDTDIVPGKRWAHTLGAELQKNDVGIICLTPDNLLKPWILFEAGALAKSVEESQLIPLRLGVQPSQLPGPLALFQSVECSEDGLKAMVFALRKTDNSSRLSELQLNQAFSMWWPLLKETLPHYDLTSGEQNSSESQSAAVKTDRQLLEQILEVSRAANKVTHQEIVTDLHGWADRLANEADRLEAIEAADRHAVAAGAAASRLRDWEAELRQAIQTIQTVPRK